MQLYCKNTKCKESSPLFERQIANAAVAIVIEMWAKCTFKNSIHMLVYKEKVFFMCPVTCDKADTLTSAFVSLNLQVSSFSVVFFFLRGNRADLTLYLGFWDDYIKGHSIQSRKEHLIRQFGKIKVSKQNWSWKVHHLTAATCFLHWSRKLWDWICHTVQYM